MARRPSLLYAMVSLQAIFVLFDLAAPFLTGTFIYYGGTEFIIAYLMGVLDFILIIGFMRGSKWAWFFGLFFSGINIINYAISYLSDPIALYVILLFMRLGVIFCLRSNSVREYFDIAGFTR
ncbi:MAG: hypothetical protein H5T34_07125 [Candidatus Methanomethyliales bacterium]|nr:hypothetical protein [Candidatus Methanomethylicales archaeon]